MNGLPTQELHRNLPPSCLDLPQKDCGPFPQRMLDMVISCPACRGPISIKSQDFLETMPLYDEMELEARAVCKCKAMSVHVVISLGESDDEEEGYYVDHIRVDPEPFEAS